MKTNNNIPAYRFQGYTDAWELRKLGKVADVFDGTHQTPRYTNQGVMFLSVEDINTLESEKYISSEDFEKEFKIFPEFNDVLMTRIGDIGTSNIVKTNDKIAYYVSLALIKPKKLESHFLNSIIQSKDFQNELWKRTLHIAFPKKINKGEISEINLMFPSLPEQKAIGTFFSTLDQHITLHQRKLDTLKEQKKTYLKLLFPAKGHTKPDLRFQGFEDDWEEVKLGDVLEERNVQQLPQEDIPLVSFTVENGVTPKTERYDREFLVRTGDKKYKYTELDDIVYNPANLKFGAISRNKFGKAVFSPIYVTLMVNKSRVFANFIEGIVTQSDFIQKALQYQEGTVYERMAVKVSDFLSLIISLPSLPEQEAIGTFFQTLDQEIAQVEDKLASLKEMKKTLLRKLFVS